MLVPLAFKWIGYFKSTDSDIYTLYTIFIICLQLLLCRKLLVKAKSLSFKLKEKVYIVTISQNIMPDFFDSDINKLDWNVNWLDIKNNNIATLHSKINK